MMDRVLFDSPDHTAPQQLARLVWIREEVRRQAWARGVARAEFADIEQEVWLALVRRPPELADPRRLQVWLARVVRNKVVDARRRLVKHRADDLGAVTTAGSEPLDPQPGPALALEQREAREQFQAALAQGGILERCQAALEEVRQQPGGAINARILVLRLDVDALAIVDALAGGAINARILVLRLLQRRSAAAVGRVLGMTAEAVRMRQCRACARLRLMPNLMELKDLWDEMGGVGSRQVSGMT